MGLGRSLWAITGIRRFDRPVFVDGTSDPYAEYRFGRTSTGAQSPSVGTRSHIELDEEPR